MLAMTNFLQAPMPTPEGIAAWAAAAGHAGAILPSRVAQVLIPEEWDEYGNRYGITDPDELFDAFSVMEAVAAAARSIYREDPGHYPMPRGMEVGIDPSGDVSLVWRSDTHTITLRIGGGWASADLEGRGGPNQAPHYQPNMSRSVLFIEGDRDNLAASPRALAAVAASITLQQQGWGGGGEIGTILVAG
jgi:hypothetical protein